MGNINQYQLPTKTPIEGIMQALQAVHAGFGIPTELAQARLANETADKQGSENEAASDLAQHVKNLRLGVPDAYDPETGKTIAPQASNTSGASPTPFQQTVKSVKSGGPWVGLNLATSTGLQDYQNKVVEGQIKAGELANQPNQQRIANSAPIGEAHEKFASEAKDEIDNLGKIGQANDLLASGKPIQGKAARGLIQKVEGAYSRISPDSSEEAAKAIGIIGQLKQKYAQNESENLDPNERAALQDALLTAEKYNTQSFNSKRTAVATAFSDKAGLPIDVLASKISAGYLPSPTASPKGSNQSYAKSGKNNKSSIPQTPYEAYLAKHNELLQTAKAKTNAGSVTNTAH